ncbi:MAG: peroxiredoxin [Hyphomicrobiaceae bacterium]
MHDLTNVDWSQIPAPENDGAAEHLTGTKVVDATLPATDGSRVNLSRLPGLGVVYIYPMTGRPDIAQPYGWDGIPGARGCTAQSCAFRDHAEDLRRSGVRSVFGLSVQDTDYQKEAVGRLHLPFPLLSDSDLAFATRMRLPTFDVNGVTLLKRVTLIIEDGLVAHTFYPVFPPDRNAQAVLDWINSRN